MFAELFALVPLAISFVYLLLALLAAERLLRGQVLAPRETPPVSILVPVRGLRAGLRENLESLCTQDYPRFEVIASLTDPDDPARPVLEELRRRCPERFTFVVAPPGTGRNPKIANLHNAYARAQHELVALVDSDVRWPPGLLAHLVAELEAPQVGLVTCWTRGVAAAGAPSRLEALALNTQFFLLVLLAGWFERPAYAFGPTVLLRRTTLEAAGGLRAVQDHLADDYELGRRVRARGGEVRIGRVLPDQICGAETWHEVRDRLLRWWHIPRVYRPWGAVLMGLYHGPLWALLYLGLTGGAARGWLALTVWLAWRAAACAWVYRRHLRLPLSGDLLWLIPADLLSVLLWLRAFGPVRFAWGRGSYAVDRAGRLVPLAAHGARGDLPVTKA